MKKTLFVLLAIFIFQPHGFSQKNYLDTLWSGGIMRTFRVYVPTIYNSQTARPLVFNFHGSGGTGSNFESATKFRQVADTANFILITPNGTVDPVYPQFGQGWNNFSCCYTVNDVLFVSEMIAKLVGEFNVDTTRIYSSGYSNGGFMGYDLACQLSNKFAAIASVAGSMITSRLQTCSPGRAVSILEIHGTNDFNVPYNGGINAGQTLAAVDSVLKLWVGHDQCAATPIITSLPNTNTSDGSTVKRYVWPNCAGGSSVELLKVISGGHTWPGLSGANTNRDIIADQEIWRFFLRHKLTKTSSTADYPSSTLKWTLSPNPASEVVQLSLLNDSFGAEQMTIRILDLSGRIVLHKEVSGALSGQISIELNGLSNGLYFLEMESDARRYAAQKLMIVHE